MSAPRTEPVYFLLVDDRDENLLALEALLRRDGLVVLKARSGQEALELLLRHDVALALVDVQMPVMDGFELAVLMRGTERTRRVPIIFITAGAADHERRFRGYEAGAVDFLHKPVEADMLQSKANVFFELARQRDELRAATEQNAKLLAESRAAAATLLEADRRKNEFLAMLAHELRNPLAPIRNAVQLLRMTGNDREGIRSASDMMERQIAQLVRLVDDLLDVSRISRGRIELRRARVELAAVVQHAVEAARPSALARKQQLVVTLPNEPVPVDADPARLAQVVGNLLSNACKFTDDGGSISLVVGVEHGAAVLRVRDTGIGIAAEGLPRVFEMFTQLDTSLERRQSGLGIGLTLVKSLVDLHGGTVDVTSAGIGCGSEFVVRLPLAGDPRVESASSEEASAPTRGRARRMLIVDDNRDAAASLAQLLELTGNAIRMAHDGQAAVEAAAAFRPDVVLLDIGLPGFNGYEVCRKIREEPWGRDIVVVALTGWGQDEERRKSKQAGFDAHLVKPVDFTAIEKLLADLEVRGSTR